MTKTRRTPWTLGLTVLAVIGVAGCSMPKKASKLFSLESAWPFGDDEPKAEVPTRIVGMWTDTVLHKAGETPQRGFGGRLLFYGKQADKPVLVDGELVVYAFDETGRELTDNKPTRRYVFPADQIALHQSDSPVGPSYSFWLPWDEVGGPRTEVSLICRFKPTDGPLVVSEQTRHLLPGAMPAPATAASRTPPKLPEGVPSRPALPQWPNQASNPPAASGLQQASYQAPADAAVPGTPVAVPPAQPAGIPRQMITTSIPLPPSFEVPRGANSTAPANTSHRMRQGRMPSQRPATSTTSQATGLPANSTATQPAAAANAHASPQFFGPANVYQPPPRFATHPPQGLMYAPLPKSMGLDQPLQMPVTNPMNSPALGPAQSPPTPAQAMQQQAAQQFPQQATHQMPEQAVVTYR